MVHSVSEKCTGCNACLAACMFNAIQVAEDINGFWYPSVDSDKCIECGKCLKVCPVAREVLKERRDFSTYVAWNNDEEIRFNSSSGGLFSVISSYIIKLGGYVVGAAFSHDLYSVHHIIVNTCDDLKLLRGSKYVQSFISKEIYRETESLLKNEKLVLFSGTPCQIAGLNKYLQKHYDNLITIDIVCHGVPSTLAWNKYLDYMRSKFHRKLTHASFRAKPNGWKKFEMSLSFGEEKYSCWFNEDLYGKSFIHNMFLRKCCYECDFKKEGRIADISLGDFWKVSETYDFNDKGCSLLICNTEKGKTVFSDIKNKIYYEEVLITEAYPGNYALYKSSDFFPYRDKAFKKLKTWGFEKTVNYYTRNTLLDKILRKIRAYINFGGL